MKFGKTLVFGFFMCIGLAVYRVYFEEPYFKSVEEQGKAVGVGEVALGFFGAWLIMTIIGYFLIRNIGKIENEQA